MEELNQLQNELSMYERELASITRTVKKSTPFLPGQLDGYSEGYSYDEYTNPQKAADLKKKIEELKNRINNYASDQELSRRSQEKREIANFESRKEEISDTAKGIYDEKMNSYMSQNLWGKAKSLLSGKKPKKMSSEEILHTYGDESVSKIAAPEIVLFNEQREFYLEKARKDYADNPKELEYVIKSLNKYYDDRIAAFESTYSSTKNIMTGEVKKR